MYGKRSLLAISIALAAGLLGTAAPDQKIDKDKLEQFIRYTEGYTSVVKMTIDDPAPSGFKGFERLDVHLSLGVQQIDKIYFVSADGQIVNGTLWNLNESPFLDTLQHLPRNGPAYGPANAKVTLIVFSDFQCPYCREFAKTIREQIPKKFPNDVRVEFQDYPIESIHKWALSAAEAARCVGDGKPAAFWAFHDWIFEHQEEMTPANMNEKATAFVKTNGIDEKTVSSCIAGHKELEAVRSSMKAGQQLGIQQTPTSFINGRMVSGALKPADLEAIIQLELSRPSQVPGPPQGKASDGKVLRP